MKRILVFACLVLISVCTLKAQYFAEKQFYLGPNIGAFDHGALFGINGEYGITKNIGVGLDLGYYHFNEDITFPTEPGFPEIADKLQFKYNAFTVFGTAYYHFMPDNRIDPFLKVGIGYVNMDASLSGTSIPGFNVSAGYSSGLNLIGEAGVRFHFSDLLSFRTSIGYPYYFTTGLEFSFGSPSNGRSEKIAKAENDRKDKKDDPYALYFGYYLGTTGSVITAIKDGMKFGPNFTFPDMGFSLLVPFGKNSPFGLLLNIGKSSYSYHTFPTKGENDSTTITEKYTYTNIQPMLYLGGFTLGVKVGIPQEASAKNGKDNEVNMFYNGTPVDTNTFRAVSKDDLNTKFDVCVGGSITLVDSEVGKLKLNIEGSYNLNGLFKDVDRYPIAYGDDKKPASKYNPKPASLTLGLSYLFKLGL